MDEWYSFRENPAPRRLGEISPSERLQLKCASAGTEETDCHCRAPARTEQRRLRKEEARREEWRSKHKPRLCRKPLRTLFTTEVAFILLNNED